MNSKIQSIHFDADQKLLEYVSEKLDRLNHFFDQTIHVDVYLKLDHKSSQMHDKIVELKVSMPGKIVFSEEKGKTFEESFDMALDHAVKQVKRHKEKIRN